MFAERVDFVKTRKDRALFSLAHCFKLSDGCIARKLLSGNVKNPILNNYQEFVKENKIATGVNMFSLLDGRIPLWRPWESENLLNVIDLQFYEEEMAVVSVVKTQNFSIAVGKFIDHSLK